MQEKAAAKAQAVDAYNEAHRAKPLIEQHAEVKKVTSTLLIQAYCCHYFLHP